MQTTFTIRRFRPSDLERVMYINKRCLPENYTSLFFLDLHERFPATFMVAEEDGEVVGYIMCRIETGLSSFSLIKIVKKGHVVSIAVLPQHQRKGIGYKLLQEALQNMAREYEVKECYLEVRISNTPAISLYKKLGFEIKRVIKGYYADGEDACLMVTKLPLKQNS